jgi:predicted RNase H-like nuclease (RuvC/YqgF family)
LSGFKETTEFAAYARNALPLIAERMESLEYQVGELTQYNEKAEARVAELEAAEKACAEWAEVSQSNYQRAKAAEARVAELEAGLRFETAAATLMQTALVQISQNDSDLSAATIAAVALDKVESILPELEGKQCA